jgi:hypothetical protein
MADSSGAITLDNASVRASVVRKLGLSCDATTVEMIKRMYARHRDEEDRQLLSSKRSIPRKGTLLVMIALTLGSPYGVQRCQGFPVAAGD